jgi:hypothetical protein
MNKDAARSKPRAAPTPHRRRPLAAIRRIPHRRIPTMPHRPPDPGIISLKTFVKDLTALQSLRPVSLTLNSQGRRRKRDYKKPPEENLRRPKKNAWGV